MAKVGPSPKPALIAKRKAKAIPKIVIISPMANPQDGGASTTSMSKTIEPGGATGSTADGTVGRAAGTEANAAASGPGTT